MCSKYPVKNFTSVHCRLKGFIPILNRYTFVIERQCEVIDLLRRSALGNSQEDGDCHSLKLFAFNLRIYVRDLILRSAKCQLLVVGPVIGL